MGKVFVLSILMAFLLESCGKDDENLIITNFSESKTITLKPYAGYPYTMMNIWIKGYANDTIVIRLNSSDSEPIMKLKGKIDKRWFTDYYGGSSKIIIFEPYKATKGKLEIKVKL